MKYLDENKSNSKIDKLTELFNELVLEFNNICKNGFDEISSNSDLKSICNQINLLKNNIFSVLNKISQKNEMESILKKLTKNLSKKEKDFVSDAFQDFDLYKDNNKPINNLFNDLSNLYNMLISKKNHFLSIINNPNKANSQNALLLDIDSEIKILENKISQYKESNKHLYLNLSVNEKQSLQIQKSQIDDLNSRIISYFSKIKNDNLEIKDDLNLYIEKLNAINNLYLSLKTKFNEIINNKEFFLNLKLKKNLSLEEKYDVIESKVNQIKWEYNYKLFEIKSNFEISKQRESSFSNPKIIQIKAKIKDIENVIYSLLNEKSDYLKNQLKYILATENKQKQNANVSTTQAAPVINNENEKLLEKKVELLENQLMKQLEKINTENTNLLLNVENKINNLSNSLTSENIQSKISHFSDEFKEIISNISRELMDIKDKVNDVDSKPNLDINVLSNKIDSTLKNMDDKNLFNKSYLEDFIRLFNSNLEKYLGETINKIEVSYKENSKSFRTEVINDSKKYKDDILNQVVNILKVNLKESNLLVDRLSNKIIDFKNDHRNFVRENNKIIFSVLKKNESEKSSIQDLLRRISDKNDEMSDEAQMNKLFFHNSKLLQLDDLIKQQNDSFLNLLNDKEKIYYEVEKILLNKNKSEKGEAKLKRIESEINDIKIIINSKIESVEKSFKEKFDFINKDYIDEIQISNKIFTTDFEMAIFNHINTIEGKLINNFSDIKQNILSVVSQVYSEIETIKDSSLTLPELDEKLALLATKIDEIKVIEQEESVTKLNLEQVKKLLADSSISIEEKLSKINLLQNDLSKNISNELQSLLSENSQSFLIDMKKTLNKNTNDTLTTLEDKLAKIDISQSNLTKNLSGELHSILNENSQHFLSDMKKTLIDNTSGSLSSLEDKLSKIDSSQKDLSSNISSQLHSILNENSKHFLSDIKKTLSDNTSETMEILNERLSKLSTEETNLPRKISNEVFSVLDKNNEKFLSELNKSLELNKNETINISNKIYNEINKFRNDHKYFIKENNKIIFSVLKKNENEKRFIQELLKKISDKNDEMQDEAQMHKLFIHNSKLLQLDDLIRQQNDSFLNLVNDKENIYFEIEKILLNKTKAEKSEEKLKRIESEINNVKDIINSKIENVEKSFIQKFDFINKDYIDEIQNSSKIVANDFEIAIFEHINTIEGKLINNFSDIKQNILSVISQVYSEIESIKDSSLTLPELDEKLALLATKIDEIKTLEQESVTKLNFEEIKQLLANTNISIDDKLTQLNSLQNDLSKNISSELQSILNENSQTFLSDMKNTLNENTNDALLSLDDRMSELNLSQSDLSKNISSELKSILNENSHFFLSDMKKTLNENTSETLSTLEGKLSKLDLSQSELSKNITNELNSILNENSQLFLVDMKNALSENTSEALSTLEEKLTKLDLSQNDLPKYISGELHSILNENTKVLLTDMKKTLIDNTSETLLSLDDKLSKIDSSQTELSTNIAGQLHSILNENSQNFLTNMKKTLNDNTNETILTIDEKLSKLSAEETKLPQKISSEVFSVLDKNNEKFLTELNKSLEINKNETINISNKIYNEINKFRNDHKLFIRENNKIIFSVLKKNENEKRFTRELLKKISDKNDEMQDEAQMHKLFIHNSKLLQLDDLIKQQNDSFLNLLNDKESIYFEIEKILLNKTKAEKSEEKLRRIESEINNVKDIINSKIDKVETSFIQKFDFISKDYIDELQNSSKIVANDFEIAIFEHINTIEGKLINNFSDIKQNILSVIYQVYSEIESIKDSSLTLPELDEKLALLASKIEEIKIFEQEESVTKLNFEEIKQLLANTNISIDDKLSQLNSLQNDLSKNMSDELKSILSENSQTFDDRLSQLNLSHNDLSKNMSSELKALLNESSHNFLSDMKKTLNENSNETLSTLESKLSKLDLSQSELSKNITSELHLILSENFQNFFVDIKNVLTENTNESLSILEEKLTKLDLSQKDLPKYISSELHSILDENSKLLLVDVKKTLIDNTSETLLSLDDKLSKIDSNQSDLSTNISSQLFSILNENSQNFLTNMKKTLNDNTNETILTIDEKLAKISSEENELPHKISTEVFSILNQNNDKFLTELNKSLEINKNETINISNKIYNEINKFRNDHKLFIRENNKIMFTVLKKNENEKKYTRDLLKKISDKNDEMQDEAQMHKLFIHNSKLLQLDDLIKQQNDSFLNLLNDKESIYFEIEKILLNKTKAEKSEEKLKRIESEINNVKDIINSKIDKVETSFIQKFDFINKDYIDEMQISNKLFSTDFEIAIFDHINTIEGKLINNFSDIKQNILSVVSQVYSEIESIKDSSLTLPELDQKLALLASKIDEIKTLEQESVTKLNFEEIKQLLNNTNISIDDKLSQLNSLQNDLSKNMSSEIQSIINENSQTFLTDIKNTFSENTNDAFLSLDDKLSQLNLSHSDLSKNISSELKAIINENSHYFLSDMKKTLNENSNETLLTLESKLSKLDLSQSELSKNITTELNSILSENSQHFLIDMKIALSENTSEALLALEEKFTKLDLSQNDLPKYISTELHSILNENSKVFLTDMKKTLIDNTSETLLSLDDKLSKIDSSQAELSTNISSQLFLILNENSQNFLTNMKKTLNDNTSETLLAIDEKLAKLSEEENNLPQKISTEVFSILNQNNEKFLTELNKSLEINKNETLDISNRIYNEINKFRNDHKHFIRENNKIIFTVLKKNENEKRFTRDLLKKISDRNDEMCDEAQMNKLFIHNSKLLQLDDLIKQQNDSFLNLLNDKENIYFEIERILSNKNKNEQGEEKLKRIELEINDIKNIINSKIDRVETSFKEKFDFISKDYIDEMQISNKLFSTDFEIAIFEHINTIEGKLINNFSDIKHNILSVVYQVYSEIESIKDSSLTLPELDQKLALLASKIDEIKTFEQEESITKSNFEEIKQLLANTNISIDDKLSQLNSLQSDLSRNMSSELQSIINENSNTFLTDMKKTLNENANDAFLSLEDKIAELNSSQYNLFNSISSKLQSILDQNSQTFLTDMKNTLIANTNDALESIEEKLSNVNLSQIDLPRNISSELHSVLDENSQFFLSNMKEVLIENTSETLLSLNDKLTELNLSQSDLSKNISSELQTILDENSQYFLSDMRKTLNENTNETLLTLEEKLSKLSMEENNLPQRISSELYSILSENSKQFLTSMRDTLNENTNETLLTLEEKISRLNIEENNLPQRISEELFSVMDKKNEKLFSDLNKSLEDNKNETMGISNKIYNEINKFKNDQLVFIERNRNWFKTILENNQKNKHYIKKLLAQINSKNEELSLELESSKMAFHNNKLFELEELIARQTSDVSSLIQEKNMIYDEIERILTSKNGKEKNGDKLHRIESEISTINSNFEDKFKSLQDNLTNKFDSLNKQYINEIETEKFDESNLTKEIFNNINSIENTLLENFNSVQLNIATSIKSIYEQVELLKNKSLTESEIENRLLHLVKEIKNLKELEDLISTGDVSFSAEELNANYKKIAQDLYKQISSSYLNNSQDILSKIDQEFFKINNEFDKSKIDSKDFVDKVYEEINKYRNDQKAFILKNKNWFQSIINNNNIDKRQISQLLIDITENKDKMTDESQLDNLNIFLNKLIQLEEIIIEQNSSLIGLVEDKERIYEEIQNILIAKEDDEKEESYQQRLKTIYKDIENISHNFTSKINDLKDSFAKKFSAVQLEENEGSFNLNDVELEGKILIVFSKISIMKNKLFDNFDLVSNNISLTITDIKTQIKQIIKTSLLEKEMRNKFFHLAQQIEDIKVFELSNILNKQNVKNIDANVLPLTDNENSSKSNNNKNVVSDRLEELLELYNIRKIDKIMKASNFYYEYEKQKNELSELLIDKLSEVCSVNDDSSSRIKLLNQNSDSILESNKIILEINSLIDQQNNKINSLYLYRNSILEEIENKVLFVKYNSNLNDVSTKAHDEINVEELIQTKIDNFNNDFLNKFNSINTDDLKDTNSLSEISQVSENIIDNWNNIKEILIDSLKLMETNTVSLREDLISLITSNNVFSNNVKKMSNNLNYDLKLIDDISMKDIIVLENKRKEIDDFYRKLRYLGKKY